MEKSIQLPQWFSQLVFPLKKCEKSLVLREKRAEVYGFPGETKNPKNSQKMTVESWMGFEKGSFQLSPFNL